MMAPELVLKVGDEFGRQCALDRLAVLETEPEPEFEKITTLVRSIFDVPVAAVSLIDHNRQWFKSIQGLDVFETPRGVAFCDHTIRSSDCFRVEDASLHAQFYDNPLVTGPPYIRSYIGAPLITSDGYGVGALCAIDYKPRTFTKAQEQILISFAGLVMNQLELRKMATVDVLTGLGTRRAFVEAMETAIKACDDTKAPLSLICLDLDKFKSINDTFGHQVGDAVLSAVGRTIEGGLPGRAIAGRIGGEELAIMLAGADQSAADALAEQIRSAIEAQILTDYPDVAFTASFGVAQRQPGTTAKMWMASADAALYRAKEAGRNCVVCAGLTERVC